MASKFKEMSTRRCSFKGCPKHIKKSVVAKEQKPVLNCYYHIQTAKADTGRKHRNLNALIDPIASLGI